MDWGESGRLMWLLCYLLERLVIKEEQAWPRLLSSLIVVQSIMTQSYKRTFEREKESYFPTIQQKIAFSIPN